MAIPLQETWSATDAAARRRFDGESADTVSCAHWDVDPANPRNWSTVRKTYSVLVVSTIGFVSTLAASIYSPAHEAVSVDLQVSMEVSLLPLALYNLGMAFGPVITGAFHSSQASLQVRVLVSRLPQSPDIAAPADRTVPLSFYYILSFLGSLLGVLVGGFAVEARGWRWTQWITLFFIAVTLPLVFFLRESYRKTIQEQQSRARGRPMTTSDRTLAHSIQYFITKIVVRPLHMLLTEPIVGFFALLYTCVVASPYVFASVYNFTLGTQGLTFLGFISGCLIAPIPLLTIDHFIYQTKYNRFKESRASSSLSPSGFPPEHHLYPAMFGSLILPAGLFLFAWTARPQIHFIVPIVAQSLTILGSLLIYVSANFYMMDTYGPMYGASAIAASSLSRYTLSAAFPLFALQMYHTLGVGWATSLLGFVSVAMGPIPWVFYTWGNVLRSRSAYEREA